MNQLVTTFEVIAIIVGLTFFQKYYFLLLHKLKYQNRVFEILFGFIIRFGVIIHELCHMFFGLLSGNKLKSVSLFAENGGNVVYETKNYIGALPEYGFSLSFLFLLIFNQIGIFLTSFGPLIVGVSITFFLGEYFTIGTFEVGKNSIDILSKTFFLLFYTIFIPSFVLSYEDIEKFFYSRQAGIFSSFIASIINFLIFFSGMYLISGYILFPILFFLGVFLLFFFFLFFVYIVTLITKKIF